MYLLNQPSGNKALVNSVIDLTHAVAVAYVIHFDIGFIQLFRQLMLGSESRSSDHCVGDQFSGIAPAVDQGDGAIVDRFQSFAGQRIPAL